MPRNVHISTVSEKVKVVKAATENDKQVQIYSDVNVPSTRTRTTTVLKKKKRSKLSRAFKKFCRKIKIRKVFSFSKKLLRKFVAVSFNGKERKLNSVSIRNTNFFYRLFVLTKHYSYSLLLLILGIIKVLIPVVVPLFALSLVIFSFWGFQNYSIALRVTLGAETIAYVENEAEFESINTRVAETVVKQTGEEYTMETMPILQFAVVKKDELSDSNEVYEKLNGIVQEYLGQSYGFFIDGKMIGTSRSESDFSRVQQELVEYYITGENNERWEIINTIDVIKDTYSKNYLLDYEDLRSLFTKPVMPINHVVKKGESLSQIANKYGISVPVLRILNEDKNLDYLSSGTVLSVGKPAYQITVQTVKTITYNEIIPYSTKYIQTDDLYESATKVKTKGSNGSYTITSEIREINGVETSQTEISRTKTRDAIAQQVLVGTKKIAPSGTFIWPLNKKGFQKISSYFGWRTLRGASNYHRGVDFAAQFGTEIYAADAGTVIAAGWDTGGLGNHVKIDHGNGIYSAYGHASKVASGIKAGTKVYKGQVIAYVGSSGNSTGNHLHFALYNKTKDEWFDPWPYVKGK